MPWRPRVPSPTWRSFLRNHLPELAAIDMFVVATATFQLLYTLMLCSATIADGLFTSKSPQIPRKSGFPAK